MTCVTHSLDMTLLLATGKEFSDTKLLNCYTVAFASPIEVCQPRRGSHLKPLSPNHVLLWLMRIRFLCYNH